MVKWLRQAGLRADIEHAITITPPHFVDDEELVALERRNRPFLFERFSDGTLLITPSSPMLCAARAVRLSSSIANWATETRFGVTLGARTGCKFSDTSLLSPDAMVIAQARWDSIPAREREGFPVVGPAAMFEMLSKADRVETTWRKTKDYLRNGVPLVVFIDTAQGRVYVGRRGDEEPRNLGDIDCVDCSPEMPGSSWTWRRSKRCANVGTGALRSEADAGDEQEAEGETGSKNAGCETAE